MPEQFVVVDVGCIECGEVTKVLGVFGSEEEARHACDEHGVEIGAYFSGGQHEIEVFRVMGLPGKRRKGGSKSA